MLSRSFSIRPSARPNDFLNREPLLKAQQPLTSKPKGYERWGNIQAFCPVVRTKPAGLPIRLRIPRMAPTFPEAKPLTVHLAFGKAVTTSAKANQIRECVCLRCVREVIKRYDNDAPACIPTLPLSFRIVGRRSCHGGELYLGCWSHFLPRPMGHHVRVLIFAAAF